MLVAAVSGRGAGKLVVVVRQYAAASDCVLAVLRVWERQYEWWSGKQVGSIQLSCPIPDMSTAGSVAAVGKIMLAGRQSGRLAQHLDLPGLLVTLLM